MRLLRPIAYGFSRFTLWLIFRIGFGLSVHGQEHVPKTGPCILACTHTSFLDPPVIGASSPRRVTFLARSTLFTNPLLGAYMWSVGCVPLKRGEADLGAVREAVKRLQQQEMVAIFPEGGRQRDGRLGTAKRGVGLLAAIAKAPVVPVLIRGTFEAMPPTTPVRFHRAKISVAFGPPILYTASPTPGTTPTAARHSHEAIAHEVTVAWQRLAAGA